MRKSTFESDYHRSVDEVSIIGPLMDFLPFRPHPSWYDVYWCQERPVRRQRSIGIHLSKYLLNSPPWEFVLTRLRALGGDQPAPISPAGASLAGPMHLPTVAGEH